MDKLLCFLLASFAIFQVCLASPLVIKMIPTTLWSFLQRFYLDNVFFLREKNLSSFLLDVNGFSRVFLLKIFDFRSEPGEFLVFVLSTVSLAHRGRKTKFFSRDVPN